MAKKSNKKSNSNVGNENMKKAEMLVEKGEVFGDSIIGMMSLFAYSYEEIGIAAIGMAKALAALKSVATNLGVDIEKLYKSELKHFEKKNEVMLNLVKK